MKSFKKIFLVFLVLCTMLAKAQQERFSVIENNLRELATITPGLNDKVDLSVNGVAIQEFIRGIATTNNLNVSVDASLTTKIINNFSNVTVVDVLLFLCKKYDLDIAFIGNIISISQYIPPPLAVAKYASKEIKVSYDPNSNALSLDLSNDSLVSVAKAITRVSGKNIVYSPDLSGKIVNGFIQNTNFNAAMDKFAFSNDLKITPTSDNFYMIEKAVPNSSTTNRSPTSLSGNPSLKLSSGENKLVTINVVNTPIADVLASVSAELKVSYFLFTDPKGNTSLNISNATYDEFLGYLFNGTENTFRKEGDIYLIGDRGIEGLRATKVISLKYRTIDKIIDYVPAKLKEGLEIKTFKDLNSFIVCGSEPRIEELEKFIRDIDRVVPVISIEVIIMDVNNTHNVTSGIKAGLGTKPPNTSVFPELNLNLGASAINSVIDGINGLGIVNLGKVTPSFYVSLQLMEANGDVKINSTPLLSTLNGNEATMSIGQTIYYVETNTNIIANQSTTATTNKVYKPLNANFTMTINPIVSGDEQITMDITVDQSSFTSQSNGVGSPFNTTSRNFKSLIRVKNQEMIMLGGLDQDNKNETSSGVPVLSRIPVIKWFFSSRSKTKTKSKLTILIKPTVIY